MQNQTRKKKYFDEKTCEICISKNDKKKSLSQKSAKKRFFLYGGGGAQNVTDCSATFREGDYFWLENNGKREVTCV